MLSFRTNLAHFEPAIFIFVFRIVNKNIKDNKIGRGINFVLIDSKIWAFIVNHTFSFVFNLDFFIKEDTLEVKSIDSFDTFNDGIL